MISNTLSSSIFHISEISEHIVALYWIANAERVQLVNEYIPGDQRGPEEFNKLAIHLLTQKPNTHTLVMGDFNAHVGIKDLTADYSKLIGKNLFHDLDNENGVELKNLLQLTGLILKSSFERSRSLTTTWKAGNRESQIDHVLLSKNNTLECSNMYAETNNISDHKIKLTTITQTKFPSKESTPTNSQNVTKLKPLLRWNTQNLKDEQTRTRYKTTLDSKLAVTKLDNTQPLEWESLKNTIIAAAATSLKRPTSPITPNRKTALDKLEKIKFKQSRDPKDANVKKRTHTSQKGIVPCKPSAHRGQML